jgi:hypothetical protein
MTLKEAVALYESNWWEGLPAREVVQRQLYEERLIMPFDKFHEVVGEALGRSVWSHEFANPDALKAEFEGRQHAPASPLESLQIIFDKNADFECLCGAQLKRADNPQQCACLREHA